MIDPHINEIGYILKKRIYFSKITPSWQEFAFIILATIVIVTFSLVIQTWIVNVKVKRASYCYKDKNFIDNSGIYNIVASNSIGESLYSIKYDIFNKKYDISCECPTGDVINRFNIDRIYDLSTKTTVKNVEKLCNCDTKYDGLILNTDNTQLNNINYNGESGIVRYMRNNDNYWFDKIDSDMDAKALADAEAAI